MNYFDNYDNGNSKIPYDDVPISRNERVQRGYGGSSHGGFHAGKHTTIIISFMLVLNFILSAVCLFLIKNKTYRTINNYTIQVGTNTEVSSAIKTSSLLSSICVSAGGVCNTEYAFYNKSNSRGSGVIYRVDRDANSSNSGTIYFVTCYHVVSGYEDSAWVLLPSSLTPIQVSVLGYSSHYDLAVLKYTTRDLEGVLGGCQPISIYDSTYVSFGEKVYAIGNSLASGLSITDGLLSQINAEVKIDTNSYTTRTIQTSAEINPGNSGGGLFNSSGKFIGLINAKRHTASSSGESFTVVGTSYAIPSSIVRGVANKLIAGNKKPTMVDIGVTFSNSVGRNIEYVEYDGEYRAVDKYTVTVSAVTPGSVSYGKLRSGDVIESIEFYEVGATTPKRVLMFNEYTFEDYAFSIAEGSEIKIYLEDGKEISETYVTVKASSIVTVSD